MGKLDEATIALREIAPELLEPTKGGDDSLQLAARIREIRDRLAEQEPRWISVGEATRLLAADSPESVKTLIRMGLLRDRKLTGGRQQALLADVLRERQTREELLAIGGDDLTAEELELLHQAQPGTNPWERNQADPTR